MSSVTKRITEIKQPRGGYIKPSQFKIQKIEDGQILSEHENVHASVIGMAVDYLTRFVMVSNVRLFKDSLVKIIGDIFDSYDSLINLFGGQCQII
ncbi:MAG: hypothetical protein SPG41_00355 [Erysipelotrichaceae bacterium]|nr:hypothetical protein [Erysipelotrichaceae bacterium]